jgi:zinc transporter, ZIP family
VRAALYAVIASSALVLGAYIGVWRAPSRRITAALLAFASGALITAVAFELFESAFHQHARHAGVAFVVGAGTFILVDSWLDKRTRERAAAGSPVGFALLVAVILDGVPENLAMGVGLVVGGSPALLVAIFASNLPEAIVGSKKMRENGLDRRTIFVIWLVTAIVLALSVVAGFALFERLSDDALAWPLGFAAGAVLASLADTLMPEAYEEGGPWIAWYTSLGFLVSFLISAA